MRGCGVTAVRQYGLEIRPIIIKFDGLGLSHAVWRDVTLTEEREQEIHRHRSEIGVVHICAVSLDKFTSNI